MNKQNVAILGTRTMVYIHENVKTYMGFQCTNFRHVGLYFTHMNQTHLCQVIFNHTNFNHSKLKDINSKYIIYTKNT